MTHPPDNPPSDPGGGSTGPGRLELTDPTNDPISNPDPPTNPKPRPGKR